MNDKQKDLLEAILDLRALSAKQGLPLLQLLADALRLGTQELVREEAYLEECYLEREWQHIKEDARPCTGCTPCSTK